MKKMNLLRGALTLACALVAAACSTGVRYDISGTWKDGAGNRICLNRIVEGDSLAVVDSAVVAADFTFALRGNVDRIQKMVLTYGEDKKKAAYYAGINIGQQISNRMVKGINHELFGNDSTKSISMKNLLAGFITGATGKKGLMTPEQAQQLAQVKMMEIRTKSIADRFSENKKAGEKWLEANKKKPGVKTLPSGLQYKVIKEGNGPLPKDTSLVKVNYEGKLIDGKVFDSSYKRKAPITMRANQVIKGWTEALTRMPAGSVWEVYIPQELAYGDREQTEIKPFSTLIFKIELLEVDPKK